MYVLVDDGRVSIHDVDNLKAFHVEVSADISEAELDELLRLQDYGYVSGGSAFISVARVRESTTDVEGVAAMVDYARAKAGWTRTAKHCSSRRSPEVAERLRPCRSSAATAVSANRRTPGASRSALGRAGPTGPRCLPAVRMRTDHR